MTTLDIPFWSRPATSIDMLIGSELVRPKPSGGNSSLLRNSAVHSFFAPMDTITMPRVGVSVDGDTVEVFIADGQELGNAKWFHQVVGSLVELLSLRDEAVANNVGRVQPKVVARMLGLLISILDADTAAPSAVPTRQGGVQVEWHRNGVDFEIEVTPSGKIEYFFCSPQGESEGSIEGDTATLRQYTRHLKVA